MTYGLKWGKKVRRKEAARREICTIELRLTAVPPDMEERTLHHYVCLSRRKGTSATPSEWTDPQRNVSHSMVENLVSSTGSELV